MALGPVLRPRKNDCAVEEAVTRTLGEPFGGGDPLEHPIVAQEVGIEPERYCAHLGTVLVCHRTAARKFKLSTILPSREFRDIKPST